MSEMTVQRDGLRRRNVKMSVLTAYDDVKDEVCKELSLRRGRVPAIAVGLAASLATNNLMKVGLNVALTPYIGPLWGAGGVATYSGVAVAVLQLGVAYGVGKYSYSAFQDFQNEYKSLKTENKILKILNHKYE